MQEQDLSTAQTFKRLWPTIAPFKWGLVAAGVALVLNAAADSTLIYMLKPLLDDGFGKADHCYLLCCAVSPVLLPITALLGYRVKW